MMGIKITVRFERGNVFCWNTNNFILEISANRMQTAGTRPQLFIPINTVGNIWTVVGEPWAHTQTDI